MANDFIAALSKLEELEEPEEEVEEEEFEDEAEDGPDYEEETDLTREQQKIILRQQRYEARVAYRMKLREIRKEKKAEDREINREIRILERSKLRQIERERLVLIQDCIYSADASAEIVFYCTIALLRSLTIVYSRPDFWEVCLFLIWVGLYYQIYESAFKII